MALVISLVCSWRATAVDISYRRGDHLLVFGLTHPVALSPRYQAITVLGSNFLLREITAPSSVHSLYTTFAVQTKNLFFQLGNFLSQYQTSVALGGTSVRTRYPHIHGCLPNQNRISSITHFGAWFTSDFLNQIISLQQGHRTDQIAIIQQTNIKWCLLLQFSILHLSLSTDFESTTCTN